MTDIKIIAGRHKCGKDLDMRITDVKDDSKNIVSWIIYGVCKKCNVVIINGLFLQPEKPVQDRDVIIDYNKISEDKNEKNL